ncbi:regulator [Streptacidiphilus pinicola]|uniref:Regulator n=1 Tax=Streptacidiphilus pinicola TaxID=2219663 RepID=A0A2X0IEM5_9ACTN|nr:AAA family ATPase [Streptacidiphilus pinicola]RAG83472.1 regulator [Streptacidiphilus pinicola]
MTANGNLPAELTGFVGRTVELAVAQRLLRRARLVTVVGPGGVGKSRLARRAAAGALPDFADGAWLVPCAELSDPALLCHAVAEALRLTDGTARPAREALRDFLAPRRLLLVLDGCEHLVEEAAPLLASLLTTAPGLKVLATSREPLGVEGEQQLPLSPLPTEGPDADAVTLFAQRAVAALPGFAVTPENAEQVGALCRRLDGIPLALELAAGRLPLLSVQQINERLGDRFALLTGGARTALPRHQTLRTAIGWSHELCSAQERLLWARLSVFVGTFDLDAAQYVCSGEGLTAEEVLETLGALVAKSVLLREPGLVDGVARYRMLDTLREYGAQWLRAADGEHLLRRRHRDWYLGLATWGEVEWFSPRQLETSVRTEAAHSNLRAALEYCLTDPGEEQLALFLAGTLWYFWVGCGHLGEGRVWLDRALDLAPEPTEARAKALWVTGYLCILQGDRLHAIRLLEECRQQALDTGDDRALAYAVHRQGCAALIADDLDRAVSLFDEALWHYDQLGELNSNVLMGMFELGLAHTFRGDAATGAAWIGKVLVECERFGERWAYAYGLFASAYAAWSVGDTAKARAQARECVRLNHAFRDLVGLVLGIELLALLATEPGDDGTPGDLREAALLQGAAHTLWRSVGEPLFGSDSFNAAHHACKQRVRHGLPEAEAAEAFRRGTTFALDELVVRALAQQPAAQAGTAQRPHDRTAVGALREPLAGQRE